MTNRTPLPLLCDTFPSSEGARHNLNIRNNFLEVISTEVERSLQYKKVIAKNTVGLRVYPAKRKISVALDFGRT